MKLPLQVQSWSWIHNGLLLLASASAWSGEPLTSAVFGPPITYSNRVGDSWVNTWADDDCIYSITDDRLLAGSDEQITVGFSDGQEAPLPPSHFSQLPVNGPWRVEFPDGRGAPAEVAFDKLI